MEIIQQNSIENEIEITLFDLKNFIDKKDKKGILRIYDETKSIDWETQSDELFEKYDRLVDEANNILYQ